MFQFLYKNKILTGVVVLFLIPLNLFSQEPIPVYLSDNQWLSTKDRKDWSEYVNIILEADKLIQKSNEFYLMSYNIEADSLSDGKKKEKESSKLESGAIKNYTNALLKYKDAYTGLYAITNYYIDDQVKEHPAFQDMSTYNLQASELYSLANKGVTDEERENLSKANEQQLLAIERAILVITTPSDSYISETGFSPSRRGDQEDFEMNAGLYKMYKDYMANHEIPDPVTAHQLMALDSDEISFESFEQMWRNYLAQEEIRKQTDSVITQSITTPLEELEVAEDQNSTEIVDVVVSFSKETSVVNQSKPSDLALSGIYVKPIDPKYEGLNEFRVQIAASRTPLSISQLKAIYYGKLSVIEIKEGSYYKYQIPGFRLYSEAQAICDITGVNNAHLVAYKNNNSLPLSIAVKETRTIESEVKKKGRDKVVTSIDFSIQVAASRYRISKEKLETIYSGSESLTLVFEEGWYKYQIQAGADLSKALAILDNCKVEGAFLVAYKNSNKLKLHKALNEYKSY